MIGKPLGVPFQVHELGSIKSGRFIQKPLTIFCGPNNSGKTWAMYSLYYFYKLLQAPRSKKERGQETLRDFNKHLSATLCDLFNTSRDQIKGARFKMTDSQVWQHFSDTKDKDSAHVFLMPAERNGLHLFFRELSTRRTALLHHASKENINIAELLRDVIRSRYALPIAQYIDWLNNLMETQKSGPGEFHNYAEQIKKHLSGGKYQVDATAGDIKFKPYQLNRDGIKTQAMGLHMASSTVKSLFGLWFYLEFEARRGDILMIDEPELNIHPYNQRKMSRLLAKLVNAGLRVVISTHSDYIVREFNSLIMLSQDKDETMRVQFEYDDDEVLNADRVGAYLFDKRVIEPFEITKDDGIYATTFDTVIQDQNDANNGIYYSLKEQRDE